MNDRLFSGSVDGSLKVWDISDVKEDINQAAKPITKSKTTNFDHSDADSGIEDRQRRVQNMV